MVRGVERLVKLSRKIQVFGGIVSFVSYPFNCVLVERRGGVALVGDASRCGDRLCVAPRDFCGIRTGKLEKKELDAHVARCGCNGGEHHDARENGGCPDQEVGQSESEVPPGRRDLLGGLGNWLSREKGLDGKRLVHGCFV
jgi:hypothetical protein